MENKVDRTKGVWIILAVGLMLGLGLAVYLYIEGTNTKKIKWDENVTDNAGYEMAMYITDKEGGVSYISGYFFRPGESVLLRDPVLLLVNDQGTCYELPTECVIAEEMDVMFPDENTYVNAYYEAMLVYNDIEPGTYEIYYKDWESGIVLDSNNSVEVTHE